jgi:transposase
MRTPRQQVDPIDTDDVSPSGRGEPPVTHDVHAELAWLRAENALLRTEKEILLKAATWFAVDAQAVLQEHPHKPEDR